MGVRQKQAIMGQATCATLCDTVKYQRHVPHCGGCLNRQSCRNFECPWASWPAASEASGPAVLWAVGVLGFNPVVLDAVLLT